MEKRNIVVLLNRLIIISEFACKENRVLGNSLGMAVRILVLHIDHLRERFNDLSDEGPVLFLFLYESRGLSLNIEMNQGYDQEIEHHDQYKPEPKILAEASLLDYLDPVLIALFTH